MTWSHKAVVRRHGLRYVAGIILLALALGGVACSDQGSVDRPGVQEKEPKGPLTLAVPENGIYIGAYVDFGDAEDTVSIEAIENFENMVGKHQAIIASSSFWGEQAFPRKNVELIAKHGSVPLVFWSPWDRPYEQGRRPDRFRLENILSGMWDRYIDQWADEARSFGRPLLVAWGLEMNGLWFPWSGYYYGGGKPAVKGRKDKFAGPEIYKKAYRYVVDRVRARGVSSIQWVFHVNHGSWPRSPWNTIAQYYPGPEYVDWLGMSVYGKQFAEQGWYSFEGAIDDCYRDLCLLDPEKPVIVAEWGVGEYQTAGNKAEWLKEGLRLMKTRYTRVRAAVYWHERWQNSDETYSNLWINSSPEALTAYREAISEPFWLGEVQFREQPKKKGVDLKR